ncbi:uncharacterized protein [Rutidosis leptorrhynchoides]|uniref:uncharacterized protein n=1 Tax=Rutidosis leptorrhynchoides TaxID=125765 RepID=UPI003A99C1AD
MAIVIPYVDTHRIVRERYVALVHVKDTSSLSLKSSIYSLLLMVVSVARKHFAIVNFFDKLAFLMNVVSASCKRKDIFLYMEQYGRRSIWSILDYGKEKGTNGSNQNQARGLVKYLTSFDFVFCLHLMMCILGFTNILSQALQRKDQDILKAISLVESTKEKLVMVETKKHLSYHLVYRISKLALVFPVTTTTVERCFSAIKIVKSNLRNRIGEEFFYVCVICEVERESLDNGNDEDVNHHLKKWHFL